MPLRCILFSKPFLANCDRSAYILLMRLPVFRYFLSLSLAGFGLCAKPADAQSPSKPDSCCPPGETCDRGSTGENSAKIIIADVAFEGPIHLPGSSLEPIVTSLKQKEFEVNSKWLEEIENELQNPWQDDGFYRVKIVARAVPLGNEGAYQRYSIAANVEEGLQYRVGRIEFRAEPASNYDRYETASGITVVRLKTSADEDEGSIELSAQPVFPVDELRSLMPLQEGDIFSARKIRDGLAALNRLYGEHGYIDFVAEPLTEIDEEHQIVALKIDFVEEQQFRIGKIEISGLDGRSQKALMWNIKSGDVFNDALLEKFFSANQSLLPAGASTSRNIRLNRDVKNSTVDILFNFSSCARQ
jgi:outer membrane protein assembly factor BamA